MKISLLVITKNEEANIHNCISTLKDVVDEVIVVDTGSDDNTVSVAKALGAKVLFFKWNDSFADAKNYALDNATGDWIVFIDADEYFAENTALNLRSVIEKTNSKHEIQGIGCNLLNFDKDTGNYIGSCPTTRIFRNDPLIRYHGNIHEAVLYKGKGIKRDFVDQEKLIIYHTGYTVSLIDKKNDRNLAILKKEMEKPNFSNTLYYYIAESYRVKKDFENSIKNALKFIESKEVMTGFETCPYIIVISSMLNSGDRKKYSLDRIFEFAKKAQDLFPYHPEFPRFLGFILLMQKKYSEAISYFKKALELHNSYKHIEVNNFASYLSETNYYIGSIYELKCDIDSAMQYYATALSHNRYYVEAFERSMLILKDRPAGEVIHSLNQIYALDNVKDIEFLVLNLSKLGLKAHSIFYQKIWNLKMGMQDISTVYAIMFSGDFETAVKLLESNMNFDAQQDEEQRDQICLLYCAAVIMGNMFDKCSSGRLPEKWFNTLSMLCSGFENNEVISNPDYINAYMKIIKILISFEFSDVSRYLKYKNKYSFNITEELAKTYFICRYFKKAIECFEELLTNNFNIIVDKKVIHFKIGVCYYNLGNYKEAASSFKQAISLGYRENDIIEYLIWIEEKMPQLSEVLKLKEMLLKKESKVKISGCIITKNEEKNIAKCINSIKDIVCEIIVVDTGSTDGTRILAESLGARLFDYEWNNDFASAKNYALSKATGEWIIFLDADEYVAEDSVDKISSSLVNLNNSSKILILEASMINIDIEKNSVISIGSTVRIFRNMKKLRYFGEIHEYLRYDNSFIEDSSIFSDKNIVIYHTGYSNIFIKDKLKRNASLLEGALQKSSDRTELYYYLGETYHSLGEHKKAIEYLKRFLGTWGKNYKIVGHQSKPYFTIIESMLSLDKEYSFDEIWKYVKTVMSKFPYHPESYRLAGKALILKEDKLKAREYYLKALELNQTYSGSERNMFPAYMAEVNRYLEEE